MRIQSGKKYCQKTRMKDSDYFAKDSVDVCQILKKMFYESGRAYTGQPKRQY